VTTDSYPGELVMLRGLVRVLRIAARNEDIREMQRLLWQHAIDEAAAREKARTNEAAGEARPVEVVRQSRLLDEIRAQGGRWASGRVVRAYRQLGYGYGTRTARVDLAVLTTQGHLVQHDEKGRRYFTLNAYTGGHRG
jgi:hypothetical protein